MANLNDFKLLNLKCKRYYEILETEFTVKPKLNTDKEKERLGFYIFMLESICNIKDISEIINLITDQEFNSALFNIKDEDYGLDAVFIDEETNYINFFNFKFRDKFNEDRQQSLNETFLTTKFTNSLITENISGLTGKVKIFAKQIIDKLNSNDIWKLRLYAISNENKVLDITSNEISQLKELYDLECVPIGLDLISKMMSIRPNPINAILHIDKDSILPFVEDSLSSAKSYIVRISASDLIRITCDEENHRDNYKMEDFSILSNCLMDYNLLFDNVRGLIIKSKYNDNIFRTLKEDTSRFFMYNNGLTITANDIIAEDTNANKKVKLTIKNFQVVNGGQTLRTLHRFNQIDNDNIKNYLSKCELLLRIFKTVESNNVKNKIAEYTNSQNAISNIDLKSLSSEQILIEQFLDENNIIYARKIGDTGITNTKTYIHKISMEKFGQILFSLMGSPEKASNQKKEIFDKYYNQIFNDNSFDVSKSAEYIKTYYEIKRVYESNTKGYEVTDQKIFYILYLNQKLNKTIIEKIDFFETILESFQPIGSNISNARKLIQLRFKEYLDDNINNYA